MPRAKKILADGVVQVSGFAGPEHLQEKCASEFDGWDGDQNDPTQEPGYVGDVVQHYSSFDGASSAGTILPRRGSIERNEAPLRAGLRELAAERPRFGYRWLYIFLR